MNSAHWGVAERRVVFQSDRAVGAVEIPDGKIIGDYCRIGLLAL
jgi:hypothetical protein